ncbi:MAG: YHYH protein [Limisphaerales bacterium]
MKHVMFALGMVIATNGLAADPRIDNWYTKDSEKYARLYPTATDQRLGNSVTTWSWGPGVQSVPVLAGVHDVSYSRDWVYIHTSGLASYVMGPWYNDLAKTRMFPSYPADTKTTYRIPRQPTIATTKSLTGLGPIGYFVNGVALFDDRDAFYFNGKVDARGEGIWNRDAYVNEGITFDSGMAHQARIEYHYHANPIALRHQLGDHVDFDAKNNRYQESSTKPTKHSPILAWARDGLPIYGPYGYSDPMNAKSAVRRMVSGYVIRDGKNGTKNLALTGRTSLPKWAERTYHMDGPLRTSEYGPNVSAWAVLGRYIEDNDYLGDLGKKQGGDFDLDECNARYCVTPEFPTGTWAYFVAITRDGNPAFPYNIGHSFVGGPSGGQVRSINEAVTTSFAVGKSRTAAAQGDAEQSRTHVLAAESVSLVWNPSASGYEVRPGAH